MKQSTTAAGKPAQPKVLARAPAELTRGPLSRLGEGIGKVVYASEHWVVKRNRTPSEMMALILVWKLVRRLERRLPRSWGRRLLERPSRQLRLLRLAAQGLVLAVPRSVWFSTHAGEVWWIYLRRDRGGERLAEKRLAGTGLMPARITFPPTRVQTGGWPGWLAVSEAVERVEATLHQRLATLAEAGRFAELEMWLQRFLALRQAGWARGVFSLDPHLKNFGVIGDRIVLLDAGGLTDRWSEIARRLTYEHRRGNAARQLGLEPVLAGRPDIAERFNASWKAMVNHEEVKRRWPEEAVL